MKAANSIPTAQTREEMLWLPCVELNDGQFFVAENTPSPESLAIQKAKGYASMLAASGFGEGHVVLCGVNF